MSTIIKHDKSEKFTKLSNLHPCLGGEAHSKFGRVHLPVSPTCNIQCKFCKRDCNDNEDRPGVASGILLPKDAIATVKRAIELCPEITVVGIAGPGDTLATNFALETFEFVHKAYPDLILCLSTNGLLLEKYADQLVEVGVSTITVTVNAVDAKIQSQIISNIVLDGKAYYGEEAAQILIDAQLRGIKKISDLGVLVKVNTVLVPGINDKHIEETARTVKESGATLYNIIPLIPQHDLSYVMAPTCEQLDNARAEADKYLEVFRHCKHCRADACGIPGQKDLSHLLYGTRSDLETFSHG